MPSIRPSGAVRSVSVAFAHGLDRNGLQCRWRKGDPFHSGVIAAIAEHAGFDVAMPNSWSARPPVRSPPPHRELRLAARCRGPPPWPRTQRRGTAIVERIVAYTEPEVERSLLRQRLAALNSISRRGNRPASSGLLPEGTLGRLDHNPHRRTPPDGWPSALRGSWLCAPTMVAASSSAATMSPARSARRPRPRLRSPPSTPVRIGDRSPVGGAIRSSTNADLVATLGFDLVIVSSVKTATPMPGWRPDRACVVLEQARQRTRRDSRYRHPSDRHRARRRTARVACVRERVDACLPVIWRRGVLATSDGAGLRSIVESTG